MPKPILHTALFHLPHSLSVLLSHSDGNLHLAGAHHGGTLLISGYSKAIWLRLTWQSISIWKKLAFACSVVLLPLLAFLILFLLPKQAMISYASQSCFINPVLLPNAINQQPSTSYSVDINPKLTVNGYPLLSTTSCISINEMPVSNDSQNITLKAAGLLGSNIEVSTPELPVLEIASDLSEPVSPVDGITLRLNTPDKTFLYKITVNDSVVDCNVNDMEVSCPLSEFKLEQGEKYHMTIARNFKGTSTDLLSEAITLRDPVVFADSSIENGQIIYSKPTQLNLIANKKLSRAGKVEVRAGEELLEAETTITDQGLNIQFSNELPRQREIKVSVSESVAENGAYLPETFVLEFTTSGGPQVIKASISSYNVSPSHTIVLSFDSEISDKQDLQQFITLQSLNGPVEARISAHGSSVSINPANNLPACTPITVNLKDGLANKYGITGGSAWKMNSRTTCKQVFSVGKSVQGRDLTAYRFGSGSTKILFVGGMHGNERSSYRTLIAFVDELERRFNEIPSDKTVVIIPDINPDGYEVQSRTNANNIDLNRNFPSNDWVTGVHMPGGIFLEKGGGKTPLDQPESASLASYIDSLGPRLVLTYHAVARTVISNGAGDSYNLATTYSGHSGFNHYTHAHEDGVFDYPTTGEFETWLADKKGISTLLVELATMSSNELYSQRSAMWAMLKI